VDHRIHTRECSVPIRVPVDRDHSDEIGAWRQHASRTLDRSHGAAHFVSIGDQAFHDVPADEAGGTRHQDAAHDPRSRTGFASASTSAAMRRAMWSRRYFAMNAGRGVSRMSSVSKAAAPPAESQGANTAEF